jgi:hypothetical protein
MCNITATQDVNWVDVLFIFQLKRNTLIQQYQVSNVHYSTDFYGIGSKLIISSSFGYSKRSYCPRFRYPCSHTLKWWCPFAITITIPFALAIALALSVPFTIHLTISFTFTLPVCFALTK